jgi:hypothetical protein
LQTDDDVDKEIEDGVVPAKPNFFGVEGLMRSREEANDSEVNDGKTLGVEYVVV